MMGRLRERYPIWDWSLYLFGRSWGPAYSGWIYIPGYMTGFHVSLLGPCYGIHRLGVPEEEAPALDLAREIEATYPGYKPIPLEIGEEMVPDVALDGRAFGKATINECLLSQQWKSSMPDDGKKAPEYVEPEPEDEAVSIGAPDDEDDEDGPIHYHDVRL